MIETSYYRISKVKHRRHKPPPFYAVPNFVKIISHFYILFP